MKISNLFLAMSVFAASAANASHFRCAEKAEDALKKNRAQFAVFFTTGERITDKDVIGDNDYAEMVRVSVLARDPGSNNKFALAMPSFIAVAKSSDVQYEIKSRARGFEMGLYMDELDQTWMKLKGVRGTIRMKCSGR